MKQKEFIKNIWRLGKEAHPGKYKLALMNVNTIYQTSEKINITKIFGRLNGSFEVFQSDSPISVWTYRPWKYKNNWYPGMQYKGINLKRRYRPAKDVIALETANLEYCFARFASDNRVTCQLPMLTYGICQNGLSLGVLVRSFISPLTLLELVCNKKLFEKYLNLRDEDKKEYFEFLARKLGRSVRRLFEIRMCHGNLTPNNITSEGEFIDFEPALDRSFNGAVITDLPAFRVVMLERFFSGLLNFVHDRNRFISEFSHAFFDKPMKVSFLRPAEHIVNSYVRLRF